MDGAIECAGSPEARVQTERSVRTRGPEACARFVASLKSPVDRLLTHRFSLAQAADTYRLFDTQGSRSELPA